MKPVAVIPARGGSKRIPHKNIKNFFGKPMIQYSIDAALESGIFEEVIVSTDDPKIADVAQKAGARVPFTRPESLSDDFKPMGEVLVHALEYLRVEEKKPYEHVCFILATAPFIESEDLKQSYALIRKHQSSAVIPVTTFPFPIFRALKESTEGRLEMVWPEYEMARSNDLPEAYHDAGQFYWLNVETFLKDRKIYAKNSRAFHLPRHRVQDIDTPEDWERAEMIYRAMHSAPPQTNLHR